MSRRRSPLYAALLFHNMRSALRGASLASSRPPVPRQKLDTSHTSASQATASRLAKLHLSQVWPAPRITRNNATDEPSTSASAIITSYEYPRLP